MASLAFLAMFIITSRPSCSVTDVHVTYSISREAMAKCMVLLAHTSSLVHPYRDKQHTHTDTASTDRLETKCMASLVSMGRFTIGKGLSCRDEHTVNTELQKDTWYQWPSWHCSLSLSGHPINTNNTLYREAMVYGTVGPLGHIHHHL